MLGFDVTLIKKQGFTLAEVLITLVIIGVVAAITLPTVVANSNEQALRSALKKNYSILEQAARRYHADNGIPLDDETIASWSLIKSDFFDRYFNVSCTDLECKADKEIVYKNLKGTMDTTVKFPSNYSMILTDGTFIVYAWTNSLYKYRYVYVDVNGPYKNPNRLGKDLFFFELQLSGRLVPGGSSESHWPEDVYCNNYDWANNGQGCTAKVIRDKNS